MRVARRNCFECRGYMVPQGIQRNCQLCNIRSTYKSLKEVVQDRHVHFENLSDVRLALPSLFALLNLLFENVLRNVPNHQLDSKVPVVILGIDCVSWEHRILTVEVRTIRSSNFSKVCMFSPEDSRD